MLPCCPASFLKLVLVLERPTKPGQVKKKTVQLRVPVGGGSGRSLDDERRLLEVWVRVVNELQEDARRARVIVYS